MMCKVAMLRAFLSHYLIRKPESCFHKKHAMSSPAANSSAIKYQLSRFHFILTMLYHIALLYSVSEYG